MRQSVIIAIFAIACSSVAGAANEQWYQCQQCLGVRVEDATPCPVCRSEVAPASFEPTEWEGCPVCASAHVETMNPRGAIFCQLCGICLRQPRPWTLGGDIFEFARRVSTYREKHLHGTLTNRGFVYQEQPNVAHRTLAESLLRLEYEQAVSEQTRFACTGDLRADSADIAKGMDAVGNAASRQHLSLREAYLSYEQTRWTAMLGTQIIGWGKTDAATPLDVMPQDLSDFPLHEARGIPAVRGKYYVSDAWTLEAFIGRSRLSLLPRSSTRWFVPTFDPENVPADDVPEYGIRLGMSRDNVDADFVFFDGADRLPAIRFLPPFGLPMAVTHRLRMIGGDCATTVGAFGVCAEAAYRTARNDDGDRRLTLAASADRSWYDVFADRDELYAVLAYTYEDVLREGRDIEFPRPFFNTALGRLRYTFRDAHELSLDWTYTFNHGGKRIPALAGGDSYIEPSYTWRPSEQWTIRVGAGMMDGPADSFWGLFTENDRALLELRYNF